MYFDDVDRLRLKIFSTNIELSIQKEKYKLNPQFYMLFKIRNTIKYLACLKGILEKLKLEEFNHDSDMSDDSYLFEFN